MKKIQEVLASENYQSALDLVCESLKTIPDSDHLLGLAKLVRTIPAEQFEKRGFVRKRLAFLNGYTSHFVAEITQVLLLKNQIYIDLWESDYGVFESAIYSMDSSLVAFKPDICFLCVGRDHLNLKQYDNEYKRWTGLWAKIHDLLGCEIIQNTFEEPTLRPNGNLELKLESSHLRFVKQLNFSLAAQAPAYVSFNDVDSLSAFHGRKSWRDDRLYDLSKIPVAHSHLATYAANLAAVIFARFGKSKKCLVLDLDNTLWGGVIGDDGLDKIEMGTGSPEGEAFARFQLYIKALKDRGVILAVCSKNEHATAMEPFLKRSDMILRSEDISCFVANWKAKSENIVEIARRLEIGLDSIVFVDDNPAERAIVRQTLPEVTVVEMPDDPADYATALNSTALFETSALTLEDGQRTEHYRGNIERKAELVNATDYPSFLKSLEMKAIIAEFDDSNLPRITQLINKTNQFNLTTRRYSESEVKATAENDQAITRYVKLSDKYGDNGLISVLIAKRGGTDELAIDTWLMSCRVLQRGVEDLLFKNLVSELVSNPKLLNDVRRITGTYIPSPKNALVQDLFQRLGFSLDSKDENGVSQWYYNLGDRELVNRTLNAPIFIRVSSDDYC